VKGFFRNCLIVMVALLLSGCMASMSPLIQAIDKDDPRAVEDILNKGADLNGSSQCDSSMPEYESYTPLGCAAKNGRTAAAKILLDKGADINQQYGGYRFGMYNPTALILASREGHLETVKLLVERGADIRAKDSMLKYSALMWAASGGHMEIVKFLLEKGADVNEMDRVTKILPEKGVDIDEAVIALESAASFAKNQSEANKYRQLIRTLKNSSKKQEKPDQTNTVQLSDVDRPIYHNPEDANKYAIVVGVEKYSELPEATYADKDASAVRNHLIAMGFPQRNIILLTGQRATRTGIAKNLETWLPNNINQNSTVFFYYSGHGAPDPASGEAYLVPFDGDPNYITDTGYSLTRLYQKLGELKAGKVTVILDSCFSGAGGRSVLAKGARPLVMSMQSKPLSANLVVLSASQGSQISTSSPSKGHGLLTYYYLKALNEGNTGIDDIFNYIKPKVENEARSLNITQSPSLQKGF
jgi:ankyrin repeat protein